MKIDDAAKFATFANANLKTDALLDAFEGWYEVNQTGYLATGKSNVASFELALLEVLKGSGITIMKGNNSFSSWDTMSKTSGSLMTDKIIIITSCNP